MQPLATAERIAIAQKMLRSTRLSAGEQRIICALSLAGVTRTKTAKHIKQSKKAVNNCLKSPESKAAAQRSGRPKTISDRDLQKLYRKASSTGKSARQLFDMLQLPINVFCLHSLLRTSPNLKFRKLQMQPSLTEVHNTARIKLATEHIT